MKKYLQSTRPVPFQIIVEDDGSVQAGTMVPGMTYHTKGVYVYAVNDKEYIEYNFSEGVVTAKVIN